MSKHRAYTITSYGVEPPIHHDGTKYLVYQQEQCPTTGRVHWQGYVLFNSPRSERSVRLLYRGDHIEVAKGSPEQNFAYCTKDETALGSRREFGVRPTKPGSRTDLALYVKRIREGATDRDLVDECPTLVARYPRFVAHVRNVFADRKRIREVVCFLFTGPTDLGKSTCAENLFPSRFRHTNEFHQWDSYAGEPVIIWDDYDPRLLSVHQLLQLCDPFELLLNVKYGSTLAQFNVIVFTSNQALEDWYPSATPSHLAALRRRIHVVEFVPWRTKDANAANALGVVLEKLPASLSGLLVNPVSQNPLDGTMVSI